MSDVAETKVKEMRERWPDRYTTWCVVSTPDGRYLEFETDLDEVRAETIIKELAKQLAEG
jgi:hypothetical protein